MAFVRDGYMNLLYNTTSACPLPVLRWLFQVSHRGTNVPISVQCHLSHPSFALVADEHMARQDQRLPDALGDVDEKRW